MRRLGDNLRVDRFAPMALGAVLTVAMLIPVSDGGGFSWLRVLAIAVISALCVTSGSLLARWVRLPEESGLLTPFVIVGGFSALSVFHLAVTAALGLNAGGALFVDVLIVGAFAIAVRLRKADDAPVLTGVGIGEQYGTWRALGIDAGLLLLVSLLVTLWTREALQAVQEAQATGTLRVWSDFLLQATEIKYLENYSAFAGQSPYLADTAQPFYHRASYALSAAYSWIAGDGPLETATYLWTPAGIVLLGMGAYALGAALGGRRGAVAGVLVLFLAPDASMYGLNNGYFAFHWLIQVAPGSGYAIAMALLALAIYIVGVRHRRFGLVMGAALLAGMSVLFRVHVALPAIGMLAVLAFIAWRPAKPWHWPIAIVLLGGAAVAAVFASEQITLAPHLLSGQKDYLRYIDAVHLATPTAYEGRYAAWAAGASEGRRVFWGYALLLLAELGALLPALPLITLARVRARTAEWHIDAIPYVLLLVHAGITFCLPTPANGDITEWSHRSFVLVYAVVLVFEVAGVAAFCASVAAKSERGRFAMGAGLTALAVVGLVVPWHHGKNAQYGSLRDGPTACATPISPDMFRATRYLRGHASPGERMLASDTDPLAVAVALSGVQAYVSRVDLYTKLGGQVGTLAVTRARENASLRTARSFDDLAAFGRKSGVRWYLLRQSDMPLWPRELLDRAAFVSGGIRIFDLRGR